MDLNCKERNFPALFFCLRQKYNSLDILISQIKEKYIEKNHF